MSTSWRRAFCTTAPRNSDAASPGLEKQHTSYTLSSSPIPRKLSFLSRGGSNPSTPKLSSSPSLTCRTNDAETPSSRQSLTTSSNPSSPRTPLKLSLFRNSFKFRSSCGVCLNSVKTGKGTAKYTAECSHSFHFHCISDYVCKKSKLVCPVCNSIWKDASLLAPHTKTSINESVSVIKEKPVVVTSSPRVKQRKKYSRFYDDDEPILSPRFVPIPEDDVAQFKGFVVNPNPNFAAKSQIPSKGRDFGNVQVSLLNEAAIISVGYGYETRAVALRVKAPPAEVGHKLNVMVQDLRIQIRVGSESGPCEITAVYLTNKRPTLVSSGSGSVRLGDLYAGEERELLIELKVPSTSTITKQVLSVRGLYKDPSTQEVVYGRDKSLQVPQAVRSISPRIQRLRCLFIATRAVAESRRLMEYGECTSAYHLLTSAKGLLGQCVTAETAEYVKVLEAELVEVKWRGQEVMEYRNYRQEQSGQPLTPVSTWRAAEKLAKLAMVKKRDLHGLENARF